MVEIQSDRRVAADGHEAGRRDAAAAAQRVERRTAVGERGNHHVVGGVARRGADAAALPLAVARPLLLGVDGGRGGLARGVTGRIGAAAGGGGGGGALCGGDAGAEAAAVRRGVAWRSSASISECGV